MARARRILLWLLAAEIVVLAITGVWLYFNYRPTAAKAWRDIFNTPGYELGSRFRIVHGLTSMLALYTSLVLCVLLLIGRRIIGLLILVLVAAVSYTGFLLPWDQLALWAVTVGANFDGYGWIWNSDQVRFVLMDATEISVATLRFWLVGHIALGLALAALVVRHIRSRVEVDVAA